MHLSEGAEISNENDTIMKSRGPMDIMLDDIHKPRIRPEGRIYRDRSWRGTGVADLFGDMTIEGISKNIYSSKPS